MSFYFDNSKFDSSYFEGFCDNSSTAKVYLLI